MSDPIKFPQPQTTGMSILMTVLMCDDCHKQWIGLYDNGLSVQDDLWCPYCDSYNISSRQGEREVFFYDFNNGTPPTDDGVA